MSLCTGSRVNTNYERIASWGGWQCWTGDPRILETPLVAHCFSQCLSHSAMTHPSKNRIWKLAIRVKIINFLARMTLKFDRWPLKNKWAPFPCHFKLCASFHSHQRIRTFTTNDIHLQKTTMLIIDITSTQVRPILSEKLTIKSHRTFALDSYTRLLLIIHFISFEL